jgi:hypothetical protein
MSLTNRFPNQQFVKNVGRACMLNEEIEAYNTDQQENLLYRAVMVSIPPPSLLLSHVANRSANLLNACPPK